MIGGGVGNVILENVKRRQSPREKRKSKNKIRTKSKKKKRKVRQDLGLEPGNREESNNAAFLILQQQILHLTERIAFLEKDNQALKTRMKFVEHYNLVNNSPELEPGAPEKSDLEPFEVSKIESKDISVRMKNFGGASLELDDSESRCEQLISMVEHSGRYSPRIRKSKSRSLSLSSESMQIEGSTMVDSMLSESMPVEGFNYGGAEISEDRVGPPPRFSSWDKVIRQPRLVE